MPEFATVFAAVDATGAGVAVLRADGTLQSASDGFAELIGASAPLIGASLVALCPGLPPLEGLGARLGPDSPAFVHGSFGRTRRVLAAALIEIEGERCLILADRTQSQRTRAELRAGPVERTAPAASDSPRAARIRPMSEMGERTAHALALARRYRHDVTVIRLQVPAEAEADLDGIVLGCVRGVDDVGRTGHNNYLLLLPDTDIAGAKVAGRRICTKLQGVGSPSLGVAQSSADEDAASLLARAERACARAGGRGGGILTATSAQEPELRAEGAVSEA